MDASITARPIPNIAVGSSSGNYSTSSASFVAVCSVTITATGRPIQVTLQHDGAGTPTFFGVHGNATNSAASLQVVRGGTTLLDCGLAVIDVGGYHMTSPGIVTLLDTNPGTGSVTYTFNASAQAGGAVFYSRWTKLVAVEL